MRIPRFLLSLFIPLVAARADVDFVREVQPILEKNCYKCHGPEKQKGGLRLDAKAAVWKGGDDHGPTVVPGKSTKSPLIELVSSSDPDTKMPPKGDPLTAEQVALLRTWIDQGASWPDGVGAVIDDPLKTHWSFQSLKRPPVPEIRSAEGTGRGGSGDNPQSEIRNSLDAFIDAKLAEQGLTRSAEADKRTLIRRLYLVLDGLPPTPDQVAAFVADDRPQAYEELVDQLLASPRYGETWARHWLDVIPFGETHGFEVNTPRENAWPYRDYVIESFNKDTPYPRFIMEQLAGDTVNEPRGTGFIVAAAALLPGQIGKDEESKLKARQDELNDMVAGVGGAFLGLTLHCARCHDHKFDPVSQADYYSLQAIFAGVRHGEHPMPSADFAQLKKEEPALRQELGTAMSRLLEFEPLASVHGASETLRAPIQAKANIDRVSPVRAQRLRFSILATSENNRYAPAIDELEVFSADGRNVARSPGVKLSASGTYPGSSRHTVAHLTDGLYGNDYSWAGDVNGQGWVQLDFAQPENIAAVKWGRDREGKFSDRLPVTYRIEVEEGNGDWKVIATGEDRSRLSGLKVAPPTEPVGITPERLSVWHTVRGEAEEIDRKLQGLTKQPVVYGGKFEPPAATFRLNRGDATQPREEVPPAALAKLGPSLRLANDAPEQDRRLALAKWLGDPTNPLPARVLVNRLWQHHFGEGLVSTPNDFGRNGARPTNPELLDWLASEFIAGGWSVKHLQKLIVMSATWRQADAPRPDGLAKDAGTRLLWRYPARRLDAEGVRDSMLSIAGTLDLRMGGPGFSAFAPNFNYVRVYDPKPEFGPAEWRRMIYMTKVRMAQDSTFGAFDCPDAGQASPKRSRSTTALQALNLFNSRFVNQQADLLAARLQKDASTDLDADVRRGFQLAFQRDPAADELQLCASLAREHGLPTLCRVLLNANELLFIP